VCRFGCGVAPLVLFLALACASSAGAQVALPGTHVRVAPISGATPLEGSLVSIDDDSLSLRLGLSSTKVSLPMDSVRSIDVGEGLRARHGAVLRDTGIGLAIGVGLSVVVTRIGCHTHSDPECDLDYVLLGVPLGIGGALIGAHIGKNHKGEQWERVFDRARTTSLLIGPMPHHGFAIGLSVPLGGGAAAGYAPGTPR
jgi:hypothetical protein